MESIIRNERVTGGTSWADSIFRRQADSKSYARAMLTKFNRTIDLRDEKFDIFFSEDEFVILNGSGIRMRMRLEKVELYRMIGVHSFEECLEKQLNI